MNADLQRCASDEQLPGAARPMLELRCTDGGPIQELRVTAAAVSSLQVERIRRRDSGTERCFGKQYDGWTLIVGNKRLISPDGESISIQCNLLRLLLVFMRSPGRTLTRDSLMKRVCKRKWDRSDRYIDVLIGQLRRKFSDDAVGQRVIRTAYGSGYAFVLDVVRPLTPVPVTDNAHPVHRVQQVAANVRSSASVGRLVPVDAN